MFLHCKQILRDARQCPEWFEQYRKLWNGKEGNSTTQLPRSGYGEIWNLPGNRQARTQIFILRFELNLALDTDKQT